MSAKTRPYLFYDVAISICSTCLRRVDGKIVFESDRVYLLKHCAEHGPERVLLADDIDYYRRAREVFLKPSEMPQKFNTQVKWGCPYDCGLCTDHAQHSCLSIVEVTDHCNLTCPVCYASSGPHRPGFRSLPEIERMFDAVCKNEGEPDVVQISGGEPTLHPQFFEILDAARRRPIRHLMVNTNGIRIAKDPAFADRLAKYRTAFEIYLQFDSFEEAALRDLRGADLRDIRTAAVARLNELDISTTLVAVTKRGVNDHEIGKIVEWGASQPCVRGVTLQPIQDAGRAEGFDPARDRMTLTEVRRRLLEQTSIFRAEDVIPVPCHPDAIAMAYALKGKDGPRPLTGMIDPKILIEGGRNTIAFERDDDLKRKLFEVFSTAHSPKSAFARFSDLLCCLPRVALPDGIGYKNLFRVIIMQFADAHGFDVRSVKKSCVHFVHPEDGRMIPFDTYNLFYRDDLERRVLDPLRRERRIGSFEESSS
jgi:uncharacterized radical SAM superfamily Fe-S cluster-containing enzyme